MPAVWGDTTPSIADASRGSSKRYGPSVQVMSMSSGSRVRLEGTMAMSSKPYARRPFLPRPISTSMDGILGSEADEPDLTYAGLRARETRPRDPGRRARAGRPGRLRRRRRGRCGGRLPRGGEPHLRRQQASGRGAAARPRARPASSATSRASSGSPAATTASSRRSSRRRSWPPSIAAVDLSKEGERLVKELETSLRDGRQPLNTIRSNLPELERIAREGNALARRMDLPDCVTPLGLPGAAPEPA